MEPTKMQGTSDGCVHMDCSKKTVRGLARTTIYVSDCHPDVGSDGLILMRPSQTVDCRMEMYNADGSRGIMCGNGVRCVGRYIYDHGLVDRDKRTITMETLTGIKTLELETKDDRAVSVTVDMGEAALASRLPEDITVDGEQYGFVGIGVGSPHAICRADQVDNLGLERVGLAFENHARFVPNRVNTKFIHVVGREHLDIWVRERGSNETWACGTGATAGVMASILVGHMESEAEVALRGGKLVTRYGRESGHLLMTGPAVRVFRSSIDVPEEMYYD